MGSILEKLLGYLSFIPGIIALLKSAGINTGSVGDEAVKLITATQTDITNYDNGNAVVVANISIDGHSGYLVAMEAGGSAAQALGL